MSVSYRPLRKNNSGNGNSGTRIVSLLWIPVFVCGAVLYLTDVLQIEISNWHPDIKPVKEFRHGSETPGILRGFAINTPGCKLPDMDPFDAAVVAYIETPKRTICNDGIPPLFEANSTSIFLLPSSLGYYNVNDTVELKCCYRVLWRVEPKENQADNVYKYSQVCYVVEKSVDITDEFIKITCTRNEKIVYTDMFAFVPIKNVTPVARAAGAKPLNVLVIGLDAVSRLNLHRQMPRTVDYLKQIQSVELLGYNKVGDNTFPNLIPVLTGFSEEELRKTCWPTSSTRFDNCSFIWDRFKSKGFVTVYGEDSSWMGLFNYQRRGFKRQATDYAYNYFNRKAEAEIGNSHNMNVYECIGARLVYKELLGYVERFVDAMDSSGLPFFGFFWGASLSHDYLNKPKLGDEDYRKFFNGLMEKGYLNNTVLLFMSDHGIRWGDIRQTYQGRMEERLPFVMIHLPEWYRTSHRKAYSNLKRNARRLTTPFDLHETLVDLLDPYNLTDDNLVTNSNRSRAMSMFREIDKRRTCVDAGIVSHWCACQLSKDVDTNSSAVVAVAKFAVDHINSELKGYAQCATLMLDGILNARLMSHSEDITGHGNIKDYMVTVRTVPGAAIFEVTVRNFGSKYEVIGTISRLNLYGKQSACITDFHLKLYCYCKNILE